MRPEDERGPPREPPPEPHAAAGDRRGETMRREDGPDPLRRPPEPRAAAGDERGEATRREDEPGSLRRPPERSEDDRRPRRGHPGRWRPGRPPGPPGGRGWGGRLPEPAADGAIRIEDWRFSATVGTGEWRQPYPMTETKYSLEEGVLVIRDKTGQRDGRIHYDTLHIYPDVDFAARLEVRRVSACGIFVPHTGKTAVTVDLRNENESVSPDRWRTVELKREDGRLTCTVDGKPAPAKKLRGDSEIDGLLWIGVSADASSEIRKCMLKVKQDRRLE